MTTTKQPKVQAKEVNKKEVKQIRVWKVFLFSIITLGVYVLFWLYRRSHELAEPRPKTPHWIWLVSIFSSFFIALIYLMISAYTASDPHQGAEIIVYGTRVFGLLVTASVVWWMTRHAIAIARAEQIPFSSIMITGAALFFPPALAALLQYGINRPAAQRETLASPFQKAGIIIVAVGIISTGLSISSSPLGPEIDKMSTEISSLQKKTKAYESCLNDKKTTNPNACAEYLR